jgi:methylated-DNA-[protein]-cysteine S-methyltransferase
MQTLVRSVLTTVVLETPLGLVSIETSEHGVTQMHFTDKRPAGASAPIEGLALEVQRQLSAYFDGSRRDFDVPLDFETGSEFQKRCWQVIAGIPYGTCISYGEVAWAAGRPGAARAAGTACAHNPITLLVPCHRVIAADGRIGGFGSAMPRKVWLLRHEGVLNLIKGYEGAAVAHPEAAVV